MRSRFTTYFRSSRLVVLAAFWLTMAIVAEANDAPQTSDRQRGSQGSVTIRLHLRPATSEAVNAPANPHAPANQAERAPRPSRGHDSLAKAATIVQCQFDSPLELADSSGPSKLPEQSSALPLSILSSSGDKTQDQLEPQENGRRASLSDLTESDPDSHPGNPDGPASLSEKSRRMPESDFELDKSNEIPGSPDGRAPEQQSQPDDIPLEQNEHPYDAPPAKSTISDEGQLAPLVVQLSPREQRIKAEIQTCLGYFLTHPENTTRRGPWALMHATLPFGVEAEVIAGNRRVNAIGWMAYNGICAKQRMFQPTRQGFRTNVGPGVQGHEGQFLAILAQSRVNRDYPLQIGDRTYAVLDLARNEMATCRERSELTFKLIGLSYYLDQNQQWRDDRGHPWTLEKMVAEELAQPVIGAACGGSHRLMGLSYALIQHQAAGLPITGHWTRAEKYLNDYVNYAMSLQNPDGSFSTNWFESRGMDPDVERKIQTSGHILEWLIFTLPDDHLRSPKIQQGLEFLLSTIGRNPGRDWPIGPRGHALRAMALYSQRVFGAEAGNLKAYVAQSPTSAVLR